MAPDESEPPRAGKMSADDVWNEIMAGNQQQPKKEMMTLEDFLLKAEKGASSGAAAAVEPKEEGSSGWICDRMNSIGEEGMGRARAKRSFSLSAAPHKAAEMRERRMIKNRESAARSRERKQAYEAELESMAVRLEEENEVLLKEKAEHKKKRLEKTELLKCYALSAAYAECDTCNRDAETSSHPAENWLYVVLIFRDTGVETFCSGTRYKLFGRG